MTEPQPNKLEEIRKAASAELSSMGRVSHRLAMTEAGAPLQKVLSLLLPRLLNRIGINHKRTLELRRHYPNEASVKATYDTIHGKVVEMLSHIMKRVRADNQCKLPCEAILDLMYNCEFREYCLQDSFFFFGYCE